MTFAASGSFLDNGTFVVSPISAFAVALALAVNIKSKLNCETISRDRIFDVNVSLFMPNALVSSSKCGGNCCLGATAAFGDDLLEFNLNSTFNGDGVNGDLYDAADNRSMFC